MPGYGIAGADEGGGPLPWSWARERLAAARNYWLITSRPGRAPHAQAVWGVLINNIFYFSTSETSRKARNLARDPQCTVAIECEGEETIVLEGIAREVTSRAVLEPVVAITSRNTSTPGIWDAMPGAVYAVDPSVVLGIGAAPFEHTATRWTFAQR